MKNLRVPQKWGRLLFSQQTGAWEKKINKKCRVWLCGVRKIFHFCSFAALQLGTVSAFLALPETLLLTGVAVPKAGGAGLAVPGTTHALK